MAMLGIFLLEVGLLTACMAKGLWLHVAIQTTHPGFEADNAPAPPEERRARARPIGFPRLSAMPSGVTDGITPSILNTNAVPGGGRADVEAGWALIRRGDYHGAIRALNKAKAGSPDDPRLFLGLGLSHYRLAHYDSANANLKRALHLDAALEQAHTLLGDVAFMRDRLDEAVHHYESASTLDPNDVSIQDGLFRVRRAQQLETGFARIVTPHFIVKCDVAQRRGLKGLANRLEALARRIGHQLPFRSGEAIIVILYSDRRFQEFTDSPSWADGLFDGKIHIAARRVLLASREADAALAHEYAHALVHRLAGGRAPTWLDEGLALYLEGRPLSWSQAVIDDREIELTPLHALHGSFLSLSPREARLAYAQSLAATWDLIHGHGWTRIRHLLEAIAASEDFSVAFETTLKEPYHVFETSWATGQRHRSL